jgi:hypothetical protein
MFAHVTIDITIQLERAVYDKFIQWKKTRKNKGWSFQHLYEEQFDKTHNTVLLRLYIYFFLPEFTDSENLCYNSAYSVELEPLYLFFTLFIKVKLTFWKIFFFILQVFSFSSPGQQQNPPHNYVLFEIIVNSFNSVFK